MTACDQRQTRLPGRHFLPFRAGLVGVYDPWVNPEEARQEYGIAPVREPEARAYDAIIVAVGHRQFADMGSSKIRALGKPKHVLYDIKYLLPAQDADARI
jgi:UDP-N-acetyl-D-galactosamine dehydrogenase